MVFGFWGDLLWMDELDDFFVFFVVDGGVVVVSYLVWFDGVVVGGMGDFGDDGFDVLFD